MSSSMPKLDLDESLAPGELKAIGEQNLDCSLLSCRNCDVAREVAFCTELSGEDTRRLAGARCRTLLPAGVTLFREGDSADLVYSIASGTVKLYKLMSDGRRQIVGFLFSGDMFGLAMDGGYAYTAETVSSTQVCRFGYRKLDMLKEENPRLERKLFNMTVKDLLAAQEQMLLLGRKNAREKVATFLVKLSSRAKTHGMAGSSVALPMSRADIADFLGLTIETVSRTFTQLKREGVIGLPASGYVVIMTPHTLRELADGGHP